MKKTTKTYLLNSIATLVALLSQQIIARQDVGIELPENVDPNEDLIQGGSQLITLGARLVTGALILWIVIVFINGVIDDWNRYNNERLTTGQFVGRILLGIFVILICVLGALLVFNVLEQLF